MNRLTHQLISLSYESKSFNVAIWILVKVAVELFPPSPRSLEHIRVRTRTRIRIEELLGRYSRI